MTNLDATTCYAMYIMYSNQNNHSFNTFQHQRNTVQRKEKPFFTPSYSHIHSDG